MTDSFDTHLTIRINSSTKAEFDKKATKYGKPSEVLREMIIAFNEGRLKIKPDPKKETLYDH